MTQSFGSLLNDDIDEAAAVASTMSLSLSLVIVAVFSFLP